MVAFDNTSAPSSVFTVFSKEHDVNVKNPDTFSVRNIYS